MSQELIVFVTTANHEEALQLAENLVSERLCACVNILPTIESIYRWEGKVTKDQEVLLIIKSTDERYEELQKRILELHSYTTPEIIAVKIERGANAYLEWLRQSVSLEK
jgi:periplasmic divalent cation tolerance protein